MTKDMDDKNCKTNEIISDGDFLITKISGSTDVYVSKIPRNWQVKKKLVEN